jgi:hypothetical protein
LAGTAAAADAPTVFLTGPQFTYHQRRTQADGKAWNEINKGIGFEYRFQDTPIALGAGIYANSYFKETQYIGARFDLIRSDYGDVGITAAYATGYDTHMIGGVTLTWKYAQIILAPQAPGAKNSSAFGSVLMRMPLL